MPIGLLSLHSDCPTGHWIIPLTKFMTDMVLPPEVSRIRSGVTNVTNQRRSDARSTRRWRCNAYLIQPGARSLRPEWSLVFATAHPCVHGTPQSLPLPNGEVKGVSCYGNREPRLAFLIPDGG